MLRNQAQIPPLQAVANDTAIGDSASGQPCIRYVASEALEVRSKPSEDEGAVIATLPPAQRVEVIESGIAGEWTSQAVRITVRGVGKSRGISEL